MSNDWKYNNGNEEIAANNDFDTDTGVTSIVWRTLDTPYGKLNGEPFGNRLWTDGARLNVNDDNFSVSIEAYCMEALGYLIQDGSISKVNIIVSGGNTKGQALIKVSFEDKTTGINNTVSIKWGN
jgi:phage gp46-like protein